MKKTYINVSFVKEPFYKIQFLLSFAFILLSLSACATSPESLRSNETFEQIAAISSCEEISQKINKLDEILTSQSASETEKLYKDTAMSAAKTGVALSGVLGAIGPLANLGVSFMEGLHKINSKQRQGAIKLAAEEEKNLLLDAYYHKGCVG